MLNISAGATTGRDQAGNTEGAARPRRKITNGRIARLSSTATAKAVAFHAELPSRWDGPFFTAMPAFGPSPRYASSAFLHEGKPRHGDRLAAGRVIVEGGRAARTG